jgi:protein arginine kinase
VVRPEIDPRRFADRVAEWLSGAGPDSDVVVSCRVRLARNVEGYPFVSKLSAERAVELAERLRPALMGAAEAGDMSWVDIQDAAPVLRLLLRERHLVSRDLAPSSSKRRVLPGRAVAFNHDETVSIMVNEEDHLRLQSMTGGFDLDGAWERARDVDRMLESSVSFAHSELYGYLTCCPTNVGTGMRASVMLHLPALSMVRGELEKVFTAAQRTGLAVRGLYGEGSRANGDFYQISNQVTLGPTEDKLIAELRDLVPAIVRFERRIRDSLLAEQRAAVVDRVSRSYGMLRTARAMPTDGALAHLSNLRLGWHLGLWKEVPLDVLARLRVQIQKGHVQALAREDGETDLLDPSERDQLRAAYLRTRLASGS